MLVGRFLDLKSTLLKGVPKIDLFTFVLLAVKKKIKTLINVKMLNWQIIDMLVKRQ